MMKWSDTVEIAKALTLKLPDIDPKLIRHTQLPAWVKELYHFSDDPDSYDDKILVDIQTMWIAEAGKSQPV